MEARRFPINVKDAQMLLAFCDFLRVPPVLRAALPNGLQETKRR